MTKRTKRLFLFCVYNHVEYYPPSINALLAVSRHFDKVKIIQRPYKKNELPWPSNIECPEITKVVDGRDFIKANPLTKLLAFWKFTFKIFYACCFERPSVVMVADSFSLLSYKICSRLLMYRPILWYHNHDVTEAGIFSKLSIQYWAGKNERNAFRELDFFSIPAQSRLSYFNLAEFKGEYALIPNYPSIRVFETETSRELDNEIVLVFFGSIAKGRGLEAAIDLIPCQIEGKNLKLKIIGFAGDIAFLDSLKQQVSLGRKADYVSFHNPVPHNKLVEICKDTHIGLGYYLSGSTMDKTISTASNKIFEYAAMSLPVITNISIGEHPWCVQALASPEGIANAIESIANDYLMLSKSSRTSFEKDLNFEKHFEPFLQKVIARTSDK